METLSSSQTGYLGILDRLYLGRLLVGKARWQANVLRQYSLRQYSLKRYSQAIQFLRQYSHQAQKHQTITQQTTQSVLPQTVLPEDRASHKGGLFSAVIGTCLCWLFSPVRLAPFPPLLITSLRIRSLSAPSVPLSFRPSTGRRIGKRIGKRISKWIGKRISKWVI
jgi:hypothetical protein